MTTNNNPYPEGSAGPPGPPGPPGPITGGANVGGGAEIFKDVLGTNLRFRTLVAGAGMSFTPASDTITLISSGSFDPTANIVFSGNDSFTGEFSVNAPTGDVNIFVATGSMQLQANAAGKTLFLGGDSVAMTAAANLAIVNNGAFLQVSAPSPGASLQMSAEASVFIQATNGSVQVVANNGNLVLQSNGAFNASLSGDQVSLSANNGVSIGGGTGVVQVFTSNDISLNSSGSQLFLHAQTNITCTTTSGNAVFTLGGNFSVSSVGDIMMNGDDLSFLGVTSFLAGKLGVATLSMDLITGLTTLSSTSGSLTLSSGVSSITVSAATSMSISSGSSFINVTSGDTMTLQAATGLSHQAQYINMVATGGAGSIGITAATDISITSNTGNVSFTSTLGTGLVSSAGILNLQSTGAGVSVTASNDVTLTSLAANISLVPFADLIISVTNVASAAAVPTISPPVGYSYVVREDATGKIHYLS